MPDEPHTVAFVVVTVTSAYADDPLGLVVDLGDAIDSVEGLAMEGCASFPETVRPLSGKYMDAARSVAPPRLDQNEETQ